MYVDNSNNIVVVILLSGIEGNPFCSMNRGGISRNEPSLRRTLSVRGQLLTSKNRVNLLCKCIIKFIIIIIIEVIRVGLLYDGT